MYYLGEHVLDWNLGPGQRCVPMTPSVMFWTHQLIGEELGWALRGSPAIRRTTARQPNADITFIRDQLLPVLLLPGLVPQVHIILFQYSTFRSLLVF